MSLSSLFEKAKVYRSENGSWATMHMATRYGLWRFRAILFHLRYLQNVVSVGSALKIRGDVRLRSDGQATISIGDRVEIAGNLGQPTFFKVGGKLQLADDVFINRGCEIYAGESVTMGNNATVAPNVVVRDSDMHSVGEDETKRGPVDIGPDTWIGTGTIILKGVTIGESAVVGAGSVVTDDVPPNTLVAGVPASPVREIE